MQLVSSLSQSEIVVCARLVSSRSYSPLELLPSTQLAAAKQLIVAADVNAVPPAGVEGLDVMADGAPIGPHGTLGVGPLAIGNIKYQTESGLFRRMIEADKAVRFDFRDAFALARELNG